MRGREAWGLGGLWLLLLSLVSFGLVFPVGTMLCTMDSATAVSLFASASFQKAVTRSVVSASVATAMALTLGAVFAWSVTRTRMGGKNFFRFILTLPMLVPSVSHGMGFLILLGANGILTRAFALDFQIYGSQITRKRELISSLVRNQAASAGQVTSSLADKSIIWPPAIFIRYKEPGVACICEASPQIESHGASLYARMHEDIFSSPADSACTLKKISYPHFIKTNWCELRVSETNS